MDRALLYHVAQLGTGSVVILLAIDAVPSSGLDATVQTGSAILLFVGGTAMLLGNGYRLVSSDADRIDPGPVGFWLSILAAVLLFVGAVVSLAF